MKQMVPQIAPPPPKKFDNALSEGDVFESWAQPGAGYGDPLLRDPNLVAQDAIEGRLFDGDAYHIYAVELNADGSVNAEKTSELRKKARTDRLLSARPAVSAWTGKADGKKVGGVLATVDAVESADGVILACASCSTILGTGETGYRHGSAALEMTLPEISPYFGNPVHQVNEPLVFRRYLCPCCAAALDSEICRPGDEPFIDIRIASQGGALK